MCIFFFLLVNYWRSKRLWFVRSLLLATPYAMELSNLLIHFLPAGGVMGLKGSNEMYIHKNIYACI